MNGICGAAVWFGLSCVAGTAGAQESEKKLTRAAILEASKDLKDVELSLWHHAGEKSDGSTTIIKGDGTVTRKWSPYYPLTPEEKILTRSRRLTLSREDVEKLLRLFAHDGILALPKIIPELVTPKEVWPKSMRYSVGLTIAGIGSFEGEHPDVDYSKLPQSEPARALIQAIRTSVRELESRIERQDREFLTKERLLQLRDGYFFELGDIQGLWGGISLRVHADGRVEGVSVRAPKGTERGMQVRRFKGSVEKERVARILKSAADLGTFDLVPRRQTGIPDESRPTLEIVAQIGGAAYSRSIALWGGEARELVAFEKVRSALREIAAERLEQADK